MTNIFQTPEWEEFKLQTGYEKSYRVDGVLVLQKRLPFGRTMLYSPMLTQDQKSKVKSQNFKSKIKNISEINKTIFYRLELGFDVQLWNNEAMKQSGFIKAFEEMQPEHTLVLDLCQTEEEILNQMKPKGRYNIKVAEKHGVIIRKSNSVNDFYSLYEKMAKRQKITHRNRKYFENLVDILGKNGYCEVFTASVTNNESRIMNNGSDNKNHNSSFTIHNSTSGGQTVLAAAIITFYGDTAVYLFGGSSDEMRSAMAPYALHWEIIKETKQRGFKKYDFFGIAPLDQSNHPWAGVTRFKKQFGGEEIQLMGSWDLIFRPTEYKAFKIAEKIRR